MEPRCLPKEISKKLRPGEKQLRITCSNSLKVREIFFINRVLPKSLSKNVIKAE